MAEEQVGVSPVSSVDTLSYLLRALRRRGVFGEVLDTSLEDLARDIPLEMGASYTCRDISPDKLGELYRQLDSLTETFKTSTSK